VKASFHLLKLEGITRFDKMTKYRISEDVEKVIKEVESLKDKIEGKKFLVTGGAGFIGSWLCDALYQLDAKIVCLDNFITGSKENIKHLLGKENFEIVSSNVCEFQTGENFDYIIHAASIASPSIYQKYPIETLDTSLIGTRRLLELARKKDVKSFLFTSTSEVYGNVPPEMIPTPETYYGFVNSFGPRCMYSEGKRAAEAYCYSYFYKYKLPIRVARIFNTYGPKLDTSNACYGRVVIKFIDQALKGKLLTVYGEGKQTRSFCYITDTIHGLLKLLLLDGLDGEVVNIGSDREIKIIDLAYKIKNITKSNSEIIFQPLPKGDPLRRCPDLTKARNILKYHPKVNLEEGISKTVEWYKNIIK
jgi:UDP-glucuronate decarboxylase